jgi:hypothetical protein
VGRGDNIPYLHTPEEVRNYFGNNLLVEKQPPKSISGGMGSYVFLYKAESFEQLKEFAAFILQRVDGTAWF